MQQQHQNPTASGSKGATYYTDIIAANRELKNSVKSLKVSRIEEALERL